jgi:2-keto-3-deoxygluconate permease
MSFAVGTGISLATVLTGGVQGIFLGVAVVFFTGGLTYLGYRFILRRGPKSGIGFAAGTTAGNAVAVPTAVAAADPRFLDFVPSAAAQTATAVLVTAILAPIVASWVLKRAGGLTVHDPVPEIATSEADSEVQPAK